MPVMKNSNKQPLKEGGPVPKEILTPSYSEDTHYAMGKIGDVTVVGLVDNDEAFVIPVPLFELLIAFYAEQAYGVTADEPFTEDDDTDGRVLN